MGMEGWTSITANTTPQALQQPPSDQPTKPTTMPPIRILKAIGAKQEIMSIYHLSMVPHNNITKLIEGPGVHGSQNDYVFEESVKFLGNSFYPIIQDSFSDTVLDTNPDAGNGSATHAGTVTEQTVPNEVTGIPAESAVASLNPGAEIRSHKFFSPRIPHTFPQAKKRRALAASCRHFPPTPTGLLHFLPSTLVQPTKTSTRMECKTSLSMRSAATQRMEQVIQLLRWEKNQPQGNLCYLLSDALMTLALAILCYAVSTFPIQAGPRFRIPAYS